MSFALDVPVTQMDVFHRLLGTAITMAQFFQALVPAIALLVLWDLGKLIGRRSQAVRARS